MLSQDLHVEPEAPPEPRPGVASPVSLELGPARQACPPHKPRISLAVGILGEQPKLSGTHMDQVVQLPLILLQLLEVLGQSFKPPTDPHRCMAASVGTHREG